MKSRISLVSYIIPHVFSGIHCTPADEFFRGRAKSIKRSPSLECHKKMRDCNGRRPTDREGSPSLPMRYLPTFILLSGSYAPTPPLFPPPATEPSIIYPPPDKESSIHGGQKKRRDVKYLWTIHDNISHFTNPSSRIPHSASLNFCILPVTVMGYSSTTSQYRGILKCAIFPLHIARNSSALGASTPFRSFTQASNSSPILSSGIPTT